MKNSFKDVKPGDLVMLSFSNGCDFILILSQNPVKSVSSYDLECYALDLAMRHDQIITRYYFYDGDEYAKLIKLQ